jgi:GNAT superfamily N-acetyltransferase
MRDQVRTTPGNAASTDVRFRRPIDADHPVLVGHMNEWWGGRKMQQLFPRLWLQHFAGTSWLAEDENGRPLGFLVGFVSPDHPEEAHVHLIATSPNRRGRGLGRALYERFFEDARSHGARRVTAVTWPGNRISVAFHRAMGFTAVQGPGTMNLYGTPAYPDYDAEGEDRVVFSRSL